MMDARIVKLPKWAQDYIGHLERKVAGLQEQVRVVSDGDPESNTRVGTYGMYPDQLLANHAHVDYYLGEGRRHFDDMITVHIREDDTSALELMSEAGKEIALIPQNSNRVKIKLIER